MNRNSMFLLLSVLGLGAMSNAVDLSFSGNPYGTHQPMLYAVANNTTGAVIEFGCGFGSTDLLHEVCKQTGRVLVTLEDDLDWLNQFREKYKNDGYKEDNSGWHKMYFVPGKKENPDLESPAHWVKFFESLEILRTMSFDVCFIDQSPWLARYETIKLMKDRARYVVLHDCDYFPAHGIFGSVIKHIDRMKSIPGIFDFSDVFQHSKVYFPPLPWAGDTGPPTLVGSNFDDNFLEMIQQ